MTQLTKDSSTKSWYYVSFPWPNMPVVKVLGESRLDAVTNIGLTVWTEDEWDCRPDKFEVKIVEKG